MTSQDITAKRSTFERLLSLGRVHDAIALMRQLAEQHLFWEVTDQLNKEESSYRYLLQYAIDGVEDPSRNDIYAALLESLRMVFDRLERGIRTKDDSAIYYSMLRTRKSSSPERIINGYIERLKSSDAFAKVMEGATGNGSLEDEAVETEMFDSIWTTFPLTKDDQRAIETLLEGDVAPEYVKRHLISALMLGGMEYFDEKRGIILANTYADHYETDMGLVALTALLLVLYAGRKRTFGPQLQAAIARAKDTESWRSDLRTAFLELIRTRDTERITRKLTDEIVPEMLKMKPEIDKRMSGKNLEKLDPTELEENPEWQEMLENSGLSEKMKELSEIQEEGGDVMMGTFAHLKSFPFFHTVANWFLPFHVDHSTVNRLGEGSDVIGAMMEGSSFMCDNDKYSFILALTSAPQSQRDFMTSQLKAQNISAAELQNSSLDLAPDRRKNVINKYVQNLYRFFRLFRRKEDFADPFASAINLTEIGLIAADLSEAETLQLVSEFYFRHQYWREALGLFRLIEANEMPDSQLFQKMGYCEQKLGETDKAIRYYEQAELLDDRSQWTIRRLATLYRLSGNYRKALEYYTRLEVSLPESAAIANHLGICQMELGQYDEAVKTFYKAQYLEPAVKTQRLLAWALFMAKRFEQAEQEYERLIAGEETVAEDFLNAGHLCMALGKYPKAVDNYAVSIRMGGDNYTRFVNAMRADTPSLLRVGVQAAMIPLVMDSVAYRVENN